MRTLPVRWREALVAGIVLAAAGLLTVASQLAEPGSYTVANDLVFFLVLLGCPTLVAAGWVNRTRQVRELKRLAAIRTRQLQAETQAARIREATRIGEEVQRSIGQTLSAILVRAEGAGGAASANNSVEQVEAAARTALAEIEAAARSALQQLREHIGVLREPIGVVGVDPGGDAGPEPVGVPGALGRTNPPPHLGRADLLAALTAVPICVEAAVTGAAIGPLWLAATAPALLAFPLAIRRRHPMVATLLFYAIGIAIGGWLVPLLDLVTPILPMLLIAHAVGAYLDRWLLRGVGALLQLVGVLVISQVTLPGVDATSLLAISTLLALAVAAGALSAAATDRLETTGDLLAAVEQHRDDEIELAVALQRQAIARDLHDSVAAAATIICVLASGAQTMPAGSTDQLHEALDTIAGAAWQAVREVDASLQPTGHAWPGTVPGVATVVDDARRAGLQVALQSTVPTLPPPVAEQVARIIREALVNASRHAPGASVEVTLGTEGTEVLVGIRDGGSTCPVTNAAPGSGTGLVGLAERVASAGGSLTHGPLRPRGYQVLARLPLGWETPA